MSAMASTDLGDPRAKRLGSMLRGVGETKLRKWIARGQEYFAAEAEAQKRVEREKRKEAERQKRIRVHLKSLKISWPESFDPETDNGFDHENYTGPAWSKPEGTWRLGVPELGWYRAEVTNGKSDYYYRRDHELLPVFEVVY